MNIPQQQSNDHQNDGRTLPPYSPPSPQFPSNSLLLIQQASQCYALGDLDGALASYERLVQIEPSNHVLLANKSAILLRMERAKEALETAQKSIQFGANWPKAHFRRGEALMALGRAEEAVLAHAEAVRLDKGIDTQFRAALLKSVEACPGQTGVFFNHLLSQIQLVDLEDDCFALFSAIGESFLQTGLPEIALNLFKMATQFQAPNVQISMATFGQMALAESKLGNWMKAVEMMGCQLENAVQLDDGLAQMEIHRALADLKASKLANLEKAIGHKREQLKIGEKKCVLSQKRHLEIRIDFANLLLAKGEIVEAQGEFKSILQKEPSNCSALLGLGRALLSIGDLVAAASIFTRVERLESEQEGEFWAEAILLRAKCQLTKGEVEKAEELAQKLFKNCEKGMHGLLEFRAELCGLLGHIQLAKNSRTDVAVVWAKRQLEAGIGLANLWVQAEALNLLMRCYAQRGEWPNASKVAEKLLSLLEDGHLMGSNLKEEILEGICRLWQRMDKQENVRKVIEFRMGMNGQGEGHGVEWMALAVELAELEMEMGRKEKCAELVQNIEESMPDMDKAIADGKHCHLPVAILQLKAQLEWEMADEKEGARALMEKALMLAQERELSKREGWICTLLGEWAEAEGVLEEANVYLRQAIGLGRRAEGAEDRWSGGEMGRNGKMLLRAFASLGRVLNHQCLWEDAFQVVRSQLRLQRELREPSVERTGTMLLLGKILKENGEVEAAEKLLSRAKKRSKLAGAREEADLARRILAECRLAIQQKNATLEGDYVNLSMGSTEGTCIMAKNGTDKRRKRKGKNYRAKLQRRSFCEFDSEQSEGEATTSFWTGGESDAESTVSGAIVLGVDMADLDESD